MRSIGTCVCGSINNRRRDFLGCSMFEVMNVLWDIPRIVKHDELFMKAIGIFTKRENKEMFVALQGPKIQVAWLKQKKVCDLRYIGNVFL